MISVFFSVFVYNKATREDFHFENLSSMHCVTSRLFHHSRLKLQSESCLPVRRCMYEAPSTLYWRNLKTEVLRWKRINCFPCTLLQKNLKTQPSPVGVWGKLSQGNHMIRVTPPFSKSSVFNFLRFEERFRRASFSLRISVDGRRNHSNEAAHSSVDATWTPLWTY